MSFCKRDELFRLFFLFSVPRSAFYSPTLCGQRSARSGQGSARSARGGGGAAHCRVKRAGALSRRAIPACATEALCAAEREGPRALPAELPRQRIEYDLPDAQKCCPHCQRMMHRIGEDISEQLHIPPRQVW